MRAATISLAIAVSLCGCAAAPPAFHAPDGSARPYAPSACNWWSKNAPAARSPG